MTVEATVPSFDEALEAIYAIAPPPAEVKKEEALSREDRIRRQQVQAVAGFEGKIARYERQAERG
jgi:hypothetical protein